MAKFCESCKGLVTPNSEGKCPTCHECLDAESCEEASGRDPKEPHPLSAASPKWVVPRVRYRTEDAQSHGSLVFAVFTGVSLVLVVICLAKMPLTKVEVEQPPRYVLQQVSQYDLLNYARVPVEQPPKIIYVPLLQNTPLAVVLGILGLTIPLGVRTILRRRNRPNPANRAIDLSAKRTDSEGATGDEPDTNPVEPPR